MENALDIAERTYVNVDIHKAENAERLNSLEHLPDSCESSAECLDSQRDIYMAHDVFSPAMIDGIIASLKNVENAETIRKARTDNELMRELVDKYFYCG